MSAIFVDTSGWMACADASDEAHTKCINVRDAAINAGTRLVTTDFVIDETLTLLRTRLGLSAAEAWWRQIIQSHRLRWERIDVARFDAGRELFFRYKDKKFSFTDCTSFAVMRELRLTRALTTDPHFRQMGFTVVSAAGKRAARQAPRRSGRE